jgi:beta-fructofuranosidase
MTDLFWTPRKHRIGDITIIRVGDEYHLFTEQAPIEWNGGMGDAFAGQRSVGHAVSKDMFEWTELPPAIACGKPGEFDAYSIYHMDVFINDGTWYMFYTGLDKGGPGEQQSVGLATSRDGVRWTKHGKNPVLRADPRWYEQAIPREAAYQEKDFDRLWFRDPMVIRDPETGKFGMIVVARDKAKHPDVRGCLAWATSDDLLNWTPHPPIYSPGRFHTIESPSMFERAGQHYIQFMTARYWGTPYQSSDPYQDAGNFYAISRSGWEGPYKAPADEQLTTTPKQLRMGATRTVQGRDGEFYYYGWLMLFPVGDDTPMRRNHHMVVPPPRRVRFADDGEMQVVWHEGLERYTRPVALPVMKDPAFVSVNGTVAAKNFAGSSVALFLDRYDNVIFSARLRFTHGDRAGLILRSGWQAVVDRRRRRVEFGIVGRSEFIDARAWQPTDEVVMKVVANQESVEVYLDNRLLIHQVRHRETEGQVGFIIENAEVQFTEPSLLVFNKD